MSEIKPITVKCYSGHKAFERPLSLKIGSKWLQVMRILESWTQESKDSSKSNRRVYFRIRALDGSIDDKCIDLKKINIYKIFYNYDEDKWYLET